MERVRRLAQNERLAGHAGFWWGFAEGLFFFIVPDVYITFATLFSLRAGAVAWGFSIAGSAVAVSVIHLLAVGSGLDYLAFLQAIPGISRPLVERVVGQLASDGLPYTPLLVLGGVPLKLYAAAAFSTGLSFSSVLLWTVFARLVRIAPAYAVVSTLRWLLGRRVDAHANAWSSVHILFWLGFYVFYFVAMT